jgi:hypothetical protein
MRVCVCFEIRSAAGARHALFLVACIRRQSVGGSLQLFAISLLLPSSQGKRLLNHIMTKKEGNEEQGEELYEQQKECGLERRRDLKGHLRTQHESLIQNQFC